MASAKANGVAKIANGGANGSWQMSGEK